MTTPMPAARHRSARGLLGAGVTLGLLGIGLLAVPAYTALAGADSEPPLPAAPDGETAESAVTGPDLSGNGTVPTDWVALADTTGVLTLSVPALWTDVDVEPYTADDGVVVPTIMAATDLVTFVDSFDAPGVTYQQTTYVALETAEQRDEALRGYGLEGGCQEYTDSPYDDGAFHGWIRRSTDCGEQYVVTEFYTLLVSPADNSLTLVMGIQLTGDDSGQFDYSIVEGLLASFNLTHLPSLTAPPTSSTTSPASTTTSTTSPPVTSTAAATTTLPFDDGARRVYDDTRVLNVSVPEEWDDLYTQPVDDGYGNAAPYIEASTDLDGFNPVGGQAIDYSVAGVTYRAWPFTGDTEARALGQRSVACTDAGVEPYRDPVFEGHVHAFVQCGRTEAREFFIVATPINDPTFSVTVFVRLPDPADDTAYDLILSTFDFDPERAAERFGSPSPSESPGTSSPS